MFERASTSTCVSARRILFMLFMFSPPDHTLILGTSCAVAMIRRLWSASASAAAAAAAESGAGESDWPVRKGHTRKGHNV
jgi:hypothetical protein